MKFVITVMTIFQLQKELENYDPKMSYVVEVSGSNTVANFRSKLINMIALSHFDLINYDIAAEFYRKWFEDGEKLGCDEKIEHGATVYAVVKVTKKESIFDKIDKNQKIVDEILNELNSTT